MKWSFPLDASHTSLENSGSTTCQNTSTCSSIHKSYLSMSIYIYIHVYRNIYQYTELYIYHYFCICGIGWAEKSEHSFTKSKKLSVRPSIHPSISQSINQSINQIRSVDQWQSWSHDLPWFLSSHQLFLPSIIYETPCENHIPAMIS